MKTHHIDGRALARKIRTEAAHIIRDQALHLGLGVVLVGEDPASHLYVRLKERACAEAGIRFEKRVFAENATESAVRDAIETFNRRPDIHAILVQLPLPDQFDESSMIATIDPTKDVDGFHVETCLVPGLVAGIFMLAKESGIILAGKSLHVIANSDVFRLPVERIFFDEGVVRAESLKTADIVVVAVGKPKTLTKDMIKPGVVVIDVGTNRIGAKVVGDAGDLEGVAGAVTPVPGGVGPVTVAMLIRNTVELALRQKK